MQGLGFARATTDTVRAEAGRQRALRLRPLCLRRFAVVLENHVVADDDEPALKRQRLEINCQDPSIKVSASLRLLPFLPGLPTPLHRPRGPTEGNPLPGRGSPRSLARCSPRLDLHGDPGRMASAGPLRVRGPGSPEPVPRALPSSPALEEEVEAAFPAPGSCVVRSLVGAGPR